jgi:hypothetical protein
MPTKNGVGLDEQESVTPGVGVGACKNKHHAIERIELGLFRISGKQDELLTKRGVFCTKLTWGTRQIGDQAAESGLWLRYIKGGSGEACNDDFRGTHPTLE